MWARIFICRRAAWSIPLIRIHERADIIGDRSLLTPPRAFIPAEKPWPPRNRTAAPRPTSSAAPSNPASDVGAKITNCHPYTPMAAASAAAEPRLRRWKRAGLSRSRSIDQQSPQGCRVSAFADSGRSARKALTASCQQRTCQSLAGTRPFTAFANDSYAIGPFDDLGR
jgi:hypothetical protein